MSNASSSGSFGSKSLSKAQPTPVSTPSASKSWGSMAANYFKEEQVSVKKEPNKFKREVVAYDDVPDF